MGTRAKIRTLTRPPEGRHDRRGKVTAHSQRALLTPSTFVALRSRYVGLRERLKTRKEREKAETRRNASRHVETRRNKQRSTEQSHCRYYVISRRERNVPHSSAIFCRSAFSAVLLSNRDWVSDTFRSDLNVAHVASSFSLLPLLSPSRLVPLYLLSPLPPPPLTPSPRKPYVLNGCDVAAHPVTAWWGNENFEEVGVCT